MGTRETVSYFLKHHPNFNIFLETPVNERIQTFKFCVKVGNLYVKSKRKEAKRYCYLCGVYQDYKLVIMAQNSLILSV